MRIALGWVVVFLGGSVGGCSTAARLDDSALLTVAEKSNFRATARYAEIVALLDRLAKASPVARRISMGASGEGRDIPVLLLADPPVSTPAEAARQVAEEGKLLVLAIGNIHAGEVDGKEALPMLAREIALTPNHPLLRNLIVALAPIYNTDGNERVSKDNRPGQDGPEEGMGKRENAAGLDLNRDFIKLEAPETRALVRFLNEWDPAIFIDTHTTNGSYHRYLVTYEGPKCLAGDAELIRHARDEMMPQISRTLMAQRGVPTFVYGDFNTDHTRWESYPPLARYGTNYVGLRNRISILSEGYSYASYKDRVLATRDFVRACLDYAAKHKDRIRQVLASADAGCPTPFRAEPSPARSGLRQAGSVPWGTDLTKDECSIAVRSQPGPADERVTVAGFVEEQHDGRAVSTGVPRDYEVELWNRTRPTLTVPCPSAYLLPAELTSIVEMLRLHGIEVATLESDVELDVEIYRIDRVEFAAQSFQKHSTAMVEATPRMERRRLPADTLRVSTRQRLGALAIMLLEPQSEDGLVTWNYFDAYLVTGSDFPVVRAVASPAP